MPNRSPRIDHTNDRLLTVRVHASNTQPAVEQDERSDRLRYPAGTQYLLKSNGGSLAKASNELRPSSEIRASKYWQESNFL